MKAFRQFLKTEMKLSFRDMNMIIFAIFMPLIILIILGIIYGTKPAFDGAEYTFMEQSIGALCTVAICAGGLMGLPLAVADSREKKILKRFKVTPVSPVILLLAYLMMYIIYCAASLVLIIGVAVLFYDVNIDGNIIGFIGSWSLTMLSTLSIGLLAGGIAKNTKSAGIIATVLYFPMLVFSGTTLPFEVMPKAMQSVVKLFPLTQGIQLMKSTFLGLPTNDVLVAIISMTVVTALCVGISIKCFRWE